MTSLGGATLLLLYVTWDRYLQPLLAA
jgi:hypothetical protein